MNTRYVMISRSNLKAIAYACMSSDAVREIKSQALVQAQIFTLNVTFEDLKASSTTSSESSPWFMQELDVHRYLSVVSTTARICTAATAVLVRVCDCL